MASSLEVLHSWSCSLLGASFSWKVALLFGMMPAVHVAYCGGDAPVLFFFSSYLLANYHVNKDVIDFLTATIYIYIYIYVHIYTCVYMFIQENNCLCLVRHFPIVLFSAFFAAFFVFVCFKRCLRCVFKRKWTLDLCILAYIRWGGVRTQKAAQLVNTNIVVREIKKWAKKNCVTKTLMTTMTKGHGNRLT